MAELAGTLPRQRSVHNGGCKLRAEFNDQLFVRTARGMVPTPQAERIVEKARPLLEQLQSKALLQDRFDPATARQAFCFALSDVGEMVFLPALLANLHREAPLASARSVSMSAAEIGAKRLCLHLRKSAIHEQFRSRDVAAVVRCEKRHRLRDLSGCTEPAERNGGGNQLGALLARFRGSQEVTQPGRVDRTWAYRVHANAARLQVCRPCRSDFSSNSLRKLAGKIFRGTGNISPRTGNSAC